MSVYMLILSRRRTSLQPYTILCKEQLCWDELRQTRTIFEARSTSKMSTIACGIIFKDLTENILKGMSKQYLIKLSLRLSQVYSQDLIQFVDELLANYNNRLSSVTSSQLRQHSTRTLRVWRPWLWGVWKLIVLAVQHLHFQVISNFTKTLSSEIVLHKRWKEWRSVICGSEVWEFEITWLVSHSHLPWINDYGFLNRIFCPIGGEISHRAKLLGFQEKKCQM